MDGITIRQASVCDARLWAETRQQVWSATYRGIYPDSWIDQYDFAGKEQLDVSRLADPNIFSFLIMDGETCAGYFSYGPTAEEEFYLRSLYLLPAYQGRGLGRRVFAHLRAACFRLGYPGFYCHCNEHNTPARGFYTHMGGILVSIDGGHQNKAEDQCRYEFSLTAYTNDKENHYV